MALLKVIQNVLGRKQEVYVPTQKQVEIDFGLAAVRDKTFTVVDADVVATSLVMAQQSAKAATGKSQDENERESILFKCVAQTGQFTMYAQVLNNSAVNGKFIVTYLIQS
jgi:hypothetical protein